ncbi:preprotein translocase subunit YajC [Fructilactobacillus florum]|nr:preprotein translocase subunit YajC [Fructilactobacillus florum]
MGQISSIIILVVLFGLMYFFMIRPQKKQQQKHRETLQTMKKGDQVVTIGGLHGTVDSIDRDQKLVSLDCDGVYLRFNLGAIAKVDRPVPASDEGPAAKPAPTKATTEPAAAPAENEQPTDK